MKYFCCSDVHSFYTSMTLALNNAGFDLTNNEHILIICGDIFDRGQETMEVYNFINSLPKERVILIRGNHEKLYLDLLNKSYPDDYDFSNGTVRTFCAIANTEFNEEDIKIHKAYEGSDLLEENFGVNAWQKVVSKVKQSKVTEFIKSDRWVNYFELPEYVFVHSFIPVAIRDCSETKWMKYWPVSEVNPKWLEVVPDWRQASDFYWNDAMWVNPWYFYKCGLWNKEKTLVCGHWHSSDFYKHLDGYKDIEIEEICPTYYGDKIIALDACTSYTGRVNVITIEEE